jgi:hypothetical protein
MGVWGLTWFLSSVGGFVSASLAELIGVAGSVALGALAVSAFGGYVWLAFAEVRTIPAREEAAAAVAGGAG